MPVPCEDAKSAFRKKHGLHFEWRLFAPRQETIILPSIISPPPLQGHRPPRQLPVSAKPIPSSVRCKSMVSCPGRIGFDPLATLREEEAAFLRHLASCTTANQLKQSHARVLRCGLGRGTPSTFLTSLLRHYTLHRQFRLAFHAFSLFPDSDTPPTFAWNLLIRAYTLAGSPFDALLLAYNRMIAMGVPPDKFTFPFAIKACSGCGALRKGKEIHGFAIKTGFYRDVVLHNTLMHLYLHCGDETCGRLIFDKMRVRSTVSWTTMLAGLVYRGEMADAREVFDEMPVRNVVSWTAMIDGYARNGQPEEAFELFRLMEMDNVVPNEFTMVALLIACAELGSLDLGRWVHDFACKNGGLEKNVFVGTALIDMYSKCGSLGDALKVFKQMPMRSLATWNSMITSLGVHGFGRQAVSLFRGMEKDGMVKPDEITFIGVLCACIQDGLIIEGCRCFRRMVQYYEIKPNREHWNCIVQLIDRSGVELDAALNILEDVGLDVRLRKNMEGRLYVEKLVYDQIDRLGKDEKDDFRLDINEQQQYE